MKKILIVLTSLLVGLMPLVVNAADTVDITSSGTYHQNEARAMLKLVNEWRADTENNWYYNEKNEKVYPGSLPALKYDYNLEKYAMQRAYEASILWGHSRPNGTSYATIFNKNQYPGRGENLVAGAFTNLTQDAFKAWQETNVLYSGQGHRRNMLGVSVNFDSVGIACVEVDNEYKYFCAQEFGKSGSSTPSSFYNKTSAVNGKKEMTVTVSSSNIKEIEMNASSTEISVKAGETVNIPKITGYIKASFKVSGTIKPSWKIESGSENISINGQKVTGKKAGNATIKATVKGKTVTINVKVTGVAQNTESKKTENKTSNTKTTTTNKTNTTQVDKKETEEENTERTLTKEEMDTITKLVNELEDNKYQKINGTSTVIINKQVPKTKMSSVITLFITSIGISIISFLEYKELIKKN